MTGTIGLKKRQAQWTDWALPLATVGFTLAALLWGYWPTIAQLVKDWQQDLNYSVGQLVPLAAIWLLWHERNKLRKCIIKPCWWGIVLIVGGLAAHVYGLLYFYESAQRYSIVLTIAGMVLLLCGWQVFWKVRWILVFLLLMVPLPGRIHNMISGPLQSQATSGAVFVLELLGLSVVREGNIIRLNDTVELAVAEACSGLRMLTAFVVVAATLAYLINRPWWQKVALLISSIPIAIVCNLARLVVTAELYIVASSQTAERFFHDFAGLTMMPLAVFMLAGLLLIMDKLVISDQDQSNPNPPKRPPRGRTRHKRT